MGLDIYAHRGPDKKLNELENDDFLNELSLTEEDIEAFRKADLHLVGGVLSGTFGGNSASFRGGFYLEFVLDVTGVSLYQDWIPPSRVKKMYEALLRCDPKEAAKRKYDQMEDYLGPAKFSENPWEFLSELFWPKLRRYKSYKLCLENLQKFFQICVERGLGLMGYY